MTQPPRPRPAPTPTPWSHPPRLHAPARAANQPPAPYRCPPLPEQSKALVISAARGAHQSRTEPAPAQLARVPTPHPCCPVAARPVPPGASAGAPGSAKIIFPELDWAGWAVKCDGAPAGNHGSRHPAARRPGHQVNPGQMADIASADGRNVEPHVIRDRIGPFVPAPPAPGPARGGRAARAASWSEDVARAADATGAVLS